MFKVVYFYVLFSISYSEIIIKMSNLDESEENLIGVMDSLCSDLNVDPVAAKKAKDSFLHLKRHFTLDVSI